ncbi:MAG: acyl--CoA ligase [Bacteriovoracaceae bacterium]|jgi:acyl-CoA synthetase (AMP-forming)/AMP-acid ligase II|nr:acyl--CoA ligase [Bacteriovoracaceae bacterium]
MKINLFRKSHGKDVFKYLDLAINEGELTIFFPPREIDLDEFIKWLPEGELNYIGDWKVKATLTTREKVEYSQRPQLGVFTTGTTSENNNLILFTEKNLTSAIDSILSFFHQHKINYLFSFPGPQHIFGLSLGYMLSRHRNIEMIDLKGPYNSGHLRQWFRACESYGPSLLTLGTPTHFNDLITYAHSFDISPSPSLTSIAGGGIVGVKLWDEMQNILGIENPSIGYGCSEASPAISHLAPGVRPVSDSDLGEIVPSVEILKSDSQGFEFAGPNLCLAICSKLGITFPKSLKIKDRIKIEGSHLTFNGRASLLLNRGGEKFSLEEIEQFLNSEFKTQVVCLCIDDKRLGSELGILVKKNQTPKMKIFGALTKKYAKNFNPDYYKEVDLIPTNANQKIDRKSCSDLYYGDE